MIRISKFFYALSVMMLSMITVTSCGDDEESLSFTPVMPANGGGNVKSIRHLGGVTTTYDWDFVYSNKRLVSAKGVARNASDDLDQKYTYESKLTYGANTVNIKNSGKEEVQVTLNALGCIEKIKINM